MNRLLKNHHTNVKLFLVRVLLQSFSSIVERFVPQRVQLSSQLVKAQADVVSLEQISVS